MIVYKNELLPLPALPAPPEPDKPDEKQRADQRAERQATTAEIETHREEMTSLGPITAKYIRRVSIKRPGLKSADRYGIYSDMATGAYLIGNKEVKLQDDDHLIIGDKKYKSTKGLWELLTSTDRPDDKDFTTEDFNNHKRILFDTDCITATTG